MKETNPDISFINYEVTGQINFIIFPTLTVKNERREFKSFFLMRIATIDKIHETL